MEPINTIHKKIFTLLISGEHYYYMLSMDYQSKYAGTSDYDKLFKSKYNKQAQLCRAFAEEFNKIPLPQSTDALFDYTELVKKHLQNMPALRLVIAPDDPEREIETLLENLIFLTEKSK